MVKLTEDMVIARSKGSELPSVKKLNCWGSELSDVSVVQRLTNVEVLSLSVNKISTLQDFEYCSNLQELYIRKNNIKDINDVLYLRQLPKLKSLWLNDNPCSEFEQYRLTVLRALPHLQKLDNITVEPEEVQKALVQGIPLPKEPFNKRGSLTSLPMSPKSGQLEETYINDSSTNSFAGSSPIRDHNVPKSNSYCNSLEEGYDYSRNLYDEDDEQIVRRRQIVDTKGPQTQESAQPTYSVMQLARTPNQEKYRRSYADYEEDRSSVASSHQTRRQSYSGTTTSAKSQVRQVSLRANIESQADNDYDYRPYARLEYPNASRTYISRDDPYVTSRYNNGVCPSSTNNSPLSPDANKNHRNEATAVIRRQSKDHQPEMVWTEEYSHQRREQQMETASVRSSDNPPCARTFTSRPKSKNANLLSAVLCLIKELDYHGLEVAEMAIHRRMDEIED